MRASNKRNYSKLGKQIKKKLIDKTLTGTLKITRTNGTRLWS